MQRHQVADKASVSEIRKRIRGELSRAGIDPSHSFDCLVAVTEACTNALLHGYGNRQGNPVPEVSWDVSTQAARFRVRDYSTQRWDSHDVSPPRTEVAALRDGRHGGFGLNLMRGLMDEVDIVVGISGTTVSLVKRFR